MTNIVIKAQGKLPGFAGLNLPQVPGAIFWIGFLLTSVVAFFLWLRSQPDFKTK